jgi:hypothetical protein
MIRLKTVRELARRKRSIARVRWRMWERGEGGAIAVDTDGSERVAGTWQRWEEDYFSQVHLAQAALPKDAHGHLRPRGLIDQVPARDLWAALNREALLPGAPADMLEEYDNGLLRVIGAVESGPWRLQCDQLHDRC